LWEGGLLIQTLLGGGERKGTPLPLQAREKVAVLMNRSMQMVHRWGRRRKQQRRRKKRERKKEGTHFQEMQTLHKGKEGAGPLAFLGAPFN